MTQNSRRPASININYKIGWRIPEWMDAVGISRSQTYELLADKSIDSVKLGSARIITTHPAEFLASLAKAGRKPEVDLAGGQVVPAAAA
jgi:hypothetical protein